MKENVLGLLLAATAPPKWLDAEGASFYRTAGKVGGEEATTSVRMLCCWLDAEGASLLRTAGKAWGREVPLQLHRLILTILQRQLLRPDDLGAADDSSALAVAHLYPALFKCVCTLCASVAWQCTENIVFSKYQSQVTLIVWF